jgi:two-component system sensor histidine kinase KdpD
LKKSAFVDFLITTAILVSAFFISVVFQNVFGINEHVSTLFAFAVFLISLLTKGYVFGIVSAFIGTLAINYAFTFPYFAFNFTIPVNLISAIVMVTIALLTSALTTQNKHHQQIKAESEKERMRANLLRSVSHDIRTPLTTIYGSAATLVDNNEVLSEAQKLKMLESIKQDSDWLVRMVENLLSITRIDSGNVKLTKTPTVVDELVDSVLTKFKKRYEDIIGNYLVKLSALKLNNNDSAAAAKLLKTIGDLERISDHCSNIAGCVLETTDETLELHRSVRAFKKDNPMFQSIYSDYAEKYL